MTSNTTENDVTKKGRTLIDMNSDDQEEHEEVTANKEPLEDISSILNRIVTKKQIKNEKTQVSIYLDEDVYKRYLRFGKRAGKGARSELVNELLRKALEDY